MFVNFFAKYLSTPQRYIVARLSVKYAVSLFIGTSYIRIILNRQLYCILADGPRIEHLT